MGMCVLFTLCGAMVADVCDEDALKNGVRREGTYSAIHSWWMKVSISFAFLIEGILLESTAFNADLIQQSDHTLLWLRIYEIGLPTLFCAGTYILLRKYTLTESRAYEIKAQLDRDLKLTTPAPVSKSQ